MKSVFLTGLRWTSVLTNDPSSDTEMGCHLPEVENAVDLIGWKLGVG